MRDAIAKMKELVRDNPKYMWGWYQLAEWYGQQQAWVDCLTVAETLVRHAPRDPVGYGHRGWAKQNLGDVQAARADYVHAWDIAPTYLFAAWQLFDLHVRNQEWRKAEKILEKAQKHADKGEWAIRKVDLLVYQNKKASFPTEFENLLRNATKNPWLIDQSLMLLVQAGWWSDAEEVLHKCLDLGPHICDPWVRLRVSMGDRSVGSDVQNMSERRPERTNCVAAYAVELAYYKDAGGLRNWINEEEDCLRADTPCWAKVGWALYVAQDWQGLCEWMSDWPDHAKATPGQLLPLVKALRAVDRLETARKVSGHALTKLNPDFASSFHKVWLMYDSAMNDEVLPVQRYLETSDLGGFDGYHQMIAAMVRALWLTHTDKETGFARARRLLADAAKYAPPTMHDPALSRAYQACVSELAALRGTFGAKLWRMWRWLFPKLPQVPKPQGQ
jgi:tetratricopeptide (TPR) repeat protein